MMNKKLAFAALALFVAGTASASAACVTIKSGTLTDVVGNVITVGYDTYGYNYQAHMFNGLYENFSRPGVVVTEGAQKLVMKWSDDWLANVSCDDDKLDRGLDPKTGVSTGVSRGWVTNHIEGDYEGSDSELHHFTYFVKIVWVGPADASPDPWAAVRIWNEYAIIEEAVNDGFGEYETYGGKFREKIVPPGLGKY